MDEMRRLQFTGKLVDALHQMCSAAQDTLYVINQPASKANDANQDAECDRAIRALRRAADFLEKAREDL